MEMYIDTMLTLACILSGVSICISIIALMWICCRIDQVREKVEEVLRWL